MSKVARDPLYRRHRFPAEIIAHAVWLYFRFPLSLRMVEDVLAARDIIVTHQTIRTWAEKFGRHFANEIRVGQPVAWVTNGTLTKSSSALRAQNTGCGGLSTRRASSSMCWCKAAETPRLQDG